MTFIPCPVDLSSSQALEFLILRIESLAPSNEPKGPSVPEALGSGKRPDHRSFPLQLTCIVSPSCLVLTALPDIDIFSLPVSKAILLTVYIQNIVSIGARQHPIFGIAIRPTS